MPAQSIDLYLEMPAGDFSKMLWGTLDVEEALADGRVKILKFGDAHRIRLSEWRRTPAFWSLIRCASPNFLSSRGRHWTFVSKLVDCGHGVISIGLVVRVEEPIVGLKSRVQR